MRLGDDARRGAFYPFCEHSPEWQALLAAREIGAATRFIDLPWAALAASRTVSHRYADRELRESPYIPTLCRKLGVEDFDSLWDRLVEVDPALTPAQVLGRVHHFCYHVRASSDHISEEDLRREEFMAEQIRRAQDEFAGPILVVTGGFHNYALYARLMTDDGRPTTDDRIRNGGKAEAAEGQRQQTTDHRPPTTDDDVQRSVVSDERLVVDEGIALTPFADARLDSLTGYEAGMPSPGFYHRIWQDRALGRGASYRGLLASAVLALRGRGQIASTADLIAVETSAQALAALRGHAEVWRQDLIDAITGALIKEAIEPDTRHPFLDALLGVFRGDKRGVLADGVLLPPLVRDIREQLRAHDLELSHGGAHRAARPGCSGRAGEQPRAAPAAHPGHPWLCGAAHRFRWPRAI